MRLPFRSKAERTRHEETIWRHRRAWIALALILFGAVVLVGLQLHNDEGKPDSTTLGLFVAAGLLCFALFAPGMALDAVRRITRLKVGGVEVSLDEIKRASELAPPEQLDGVEGKTRPKNAGYDECVEKLQSKLGQIHCMLRLKASSNDYIAIAEELRRRNLLSRTEEEFVIDPRKPQLVHRRLQTETRPRVDFLAYKDGRWILVAACVSPTKKNPGRLKVAAKRLAKFKDEFENGPPIGAKFIIAPDSKAFIRSAGYVADFEGAVAVVTLEGFGLDAATGGA
jgi:hypothetical protein